MSKATVSFTVGQPLDAHGVKAVKQGLDALPGISSVSVSDDRCHMAVDFDITALKKQRIEQQLASLGCNVLGAQTDKHIM